MWKEYNRGKTIGTKGSESGIILLDYEHDFGMRITLEKCKEYFAITYGLYGNMVDTLFGDEEEMRQTVECLKIELEYFKYIEDDENFEHLSEWCNNLCSRRQNTVPKPFDNSSDGLNNLIEFSLNHLLIDMFPELKKPFEEYSGEDSYFYGVYCTYPDLLKPLVLKAIDENNEGVLKRFGYLVEDISESNDKFVDNFFYVGILEDIYFLSKEEKEILFKYLKENTIKKYNESLEWLSKL